MRAPPIRPLSKDLKPNDPNLRDTVVQFTKKAFDEGFVSGTNSVIDELTRSIIAIEFINGETEISFTRLHKMLNEISQKV